MNFKILVNHLKSAHLILVLNILRFRKISMVVLLWYSFSMKYFHTKFEMKTFYCERGLLRENHIFGQRKLILNEVQGLQNRGSLDFSIPILWKYYNVFFCSCTLFFWWFALTRKQKVQIFVMFELSKKSGMLQTTTIKINLVPRFGKAIKKDMFGYLGLHKLGGLPPLKENFCGQSTNSCP